MYNILKHAHSGWRWIVLALLLAAIANALMKWQSGKPFLESDRKLNLFAMISVHLQFLFGLVLYFVSPLVDFTSGAMKNPVTRFFTAEHLVLMLVALVLITIGHARAKRQTVDKMKFRTTLVFYLLGLVIILYSIPWPGGRYGGAWF